MTDRMVLVRTVYDNLTPSWRQWPGDNPTQAVEEMAEKQADGKARPVEVLVVEVVRRITISTRVDVIDDSAAFIGVPE